MKMLLTLSLVFLASAANSSEVCKKGDLKDCARILKEKIGTEEFRALYDQVCAENKTFKCVKITIRGEPNEEMKYQMGEHKNAHLFLTKDGSEDKIYMLELKPGVKADVKTQIKTETKSETSSESQTEKK